jgi:hypothetical protein
MKRFKVHLGFTPLGRDKWKNFEDEAGARLYCKQVHEKTGKILFIKEVLPKLTRKDRDQAMADLGLCKVVVNGKVFYE